MNHRQPITLKERLFQIKQGSKYRSTNNRRLKIIALKRNKRRIFNPLIKLQIRLVSCFDLKILTVKTLNLIINIFRWIGQVLLAKKNEPCIKHKRDRHGNSYWQIYDFTTNKSYTFDSESEVRAWIEERYNR
ncbi:MAG: hypothetical protein QNJ72_33770 [Pleurocapsa sp. MO_226.B13]|nr:hypothetical protein [Pleurocapsa sp. MO_226.B13]